MAGLQDQLDITVEIASDRSHAIVRIPVHLPRDKATETQVRAALLAEGVQLNDSVLRTIDESFDAAVEPNAKLREVTVRATPPLHGEDGFVTWLIDEPKPDEEAHEDKDHYSRCSYTSVELGQKIAHITEATPGEDGRDICGKTIAARNGKPVNLTWDDSLWQNGKGELITHIAGVLVRDADRVQVRQLVEVPGYIDFSTGNVAFTGDLVVHKGIRDCFEVNIDGSITVQGLIEAAHIKCSGSLDAAGGMAGREQGTVDVGENLSGKYLDNVAGHVFQDLKIQKEIINCQLQVDGNIDMPNGSIIGGDITPVGKVHIGSVGSDANVKGSVHLGNVPRLEPFVEKLSDLIGQLERSTNKLSKEQRQLEAGGKRLTNTDIERQTELMFQLSSTTNAMTKASAAKMTLESAIDDRSTVDMTVEKTLYAGTALIVRNTKYRIKTDIAGPFQITCDKSGQPVVQQRGSETPLTRFARTEARTTAA